MNALLHPLNLVAFSLEALELIHAHEISAMLGTLEFLGGGGGCPRITIHLTLQRGVLVVTPLYMSGIWKEAVIFFEGDSGI